MAHELACSVLQYSNTEIGDNLIRIKSEQSDNSELFQSNKTYDTSSIGYDVEDQQLELAVVDPPPLLKENSTIHEHSYYDENESDYYDGPDDLTMEGKINYYFKNN